MQRSRRGPWQPPQSSPGCAAPSLTCYLFTALNRIVAALLERDTLSGDEVRGIVRRVGDSGDLAAHDAEDGKFL